jgi:hypothetical protein
MLMHSKLERDNPSLQDWARQNSIIWILYQYVLVPALILMLIGGFALIIATRFSSFIVAPAWLKLIEPISLPFAIMMAVVIAWFGFIGAKLKQAKLRVYLSVILAGPIFGFMNLLALQLAVPMSLVIINWEEREMVFTVKRAQPHRSGKGCNTAIYLEDMPWQNSKLCNFPAEFVDRLSAGDRIAVIGTGTEFGMFVTSIRKVD